MCIRDSIYTKEERENHELTMLNLALLSHHEVLDIIRNASRDSGANIKLKRLFDRSVLVGRHMDTQDYNEHAQPLRKWVNSLFEPNTRTNLKELLFNYTPRDGFFAVNGFYTMFQKCWNALIEYTLAHLNHCDSPETCPLPEIEWYHPQPLKKVMSDIGHLITTIHHSELGDVRANIIEPHLGYALRETEMRLQQGMGCGHGLVAILELEK